MGFTGSIRRIAVAGFLAAAVCTSVCRADCDNTVYSYDDKVIVFACGQTGPELRVILLDDASTLKVSGRVAVPSSREFDTAGHYKNFLMLVRWDKFEVYDLADPTHPRLTAEFVLRKGENLSGFGRIEQVADKRFLILSPTGATEVTAEGEPAKWSLKGIPASSEIRKRMGERPAEYRFQDENEPAVTLRENEKFRYELCWRQKSKAGAIVHRHYLRKVNLGTKKDASLLLGERLETID